jgi:hypothetical protein
MYLITSDIEATRAELMNRGVDVVSFSDPDGNSWLIQEVKERAPGRDGIDRRIAKLIGVR